MTRSFFLLILFRLREISREPGVIFWIFIFPILLAFTLGLAFDEKSAPTPKKIAWLAGEKKGKLQSAKPGDSAGPEAVAGLNKLRAEGWEIVPKSRAQFDLSLRRGEMTAGFQVVSEKEGRPNFQVWFDPGNEAATALFRQLQADYKKDLGPRFEARPLRKKGSRYIDFLIPGLLALGVMNSSIWGVGWTLIQWRIKKMLRRLVATPMSRWEFVLSFFGIRILISMWEFLVLYLFAWLYFGVSVAGSWWILGAVYLAGNFAFTGLAVLVSARPENSETGNGIMNAVTMPMMILSGIFFSYENFPDWLAEIIRYLPLTILADLLRGVFNLDYGWTTVLPGLIGLMILGLVSLWSGLKIYKWH